MARFVDAIDLPVPIHEAFDYLADFSRTAEWDPGVSEAQSLTPGRPRVGSRFKVTVAFLGQQIPLEYEILEFDRPFRLVLAGGDSSVRSIDEMTFVERRGGTRVTYEARLELAGIGRFADPILEVLMQRVGRVAVRGLRERLSHVEAEAAQAPTTPAGVSVGTKPASRTRTPSRKRNPASKTAKTTREPETKGAAS